MSNRFPGQTAQQIYFLVEKGKFSWVASLNKETDEDVIVAVRSLVRYQSGLKAIGEIPGFCVPFFPIGFPGSLLPTTWWNPGYLFTWTWRSTNYTQFGNDTFSVVSWMIGPPGFYTANMDVARQVIGGGHKTSFVKPENLHAALLYWGMNLLAADKETWRTHRRIVGPAFNNQLYEMVWSETLQTYRDITAAEEWEGRKEVEVPVLQKLTFKLALLIIGRCGFGFDFTWFDSPKNADGTMTIQETLRIVTSTHLQAIIFRCLYDFIELTPNQALSDCDKLDKVLCALFEALRLFPSAHVMIREAWEDTVLQVPNPDGQEGSASVAVPKGTHIVVDVVGVQYNSRYFSDPFEFKPSRWEGVGMDSEAFTAFSVGSRACVGRKFAIIESICFLSCLLRDFEIQPLLNPGETKEQWKERVIDATMSITLGIKDVPVRFIRRS